MFSFGIWELLIILAIVLVIFGGKRLPALGKSLGETVNVVKSVGGGEKSKTDQPKDGAESDTGGSMAEKIIPELNTVRQLKTPQGKLKLLGRLTRITK
jgi:sec-independent protein translocase protein TatA